MDRREFLTLAARLSAAAALPAALVGCGGGGGGSSSNEASTTAVDSNLVGVKSQQSDIDDTNTDLNSEFGGVTSDNASTSSLLRAGNVSSAVANFFQARKSAQFDLPAPHYLTTVGNGNIWDNAVDSHQQAFEDYQHQTAKLIAALRLFDAKNPQSSDASSASARPKNIASLKASARSQLSEEESSLLDTLSDYASDLSENFNSTVLDLIAVALSAIKPLLEAAFDEDQIKGLAYSFLVYLSIDDILANVTETSVENLDFSDKEGIMMSLAKVSVASAALLALNNINDLEEQTGDTEVDFMTSFLAGTDLVNKLSLKWLTLANSMVNGTVGTSIEHINAAVAQEGGDSTQAQDDLLASGALAETSGEMKTNAAILAITSFAMKSVFNNFSDSAFTAGENGLGFASGSTADTFSVLFGSPQNQYDQAVNAATTSSVTAAARSTITEELDSDLENQDISASFSSDSAADSATAATESDAYSFAMQLAEFAYQFSSDTESDAADFASMMANLAYNFTMQTEEHAFDFAMQGMEYGYLFASQGEDVGVMADRILWMAVQIGVMADRIGEMADRIVYTEHLIVYTEMLILDFGILIYGVIKQITNLILTGLALILDREWYSPSSEDIILDTINSNVTHMLDNMHEYSLAVLDNQQALRESTQSAIDTINFAESAS